MSNSYTISRGGMLTMMASLQQSCYEHVRGEYLHLATDDVQAFREILRAGDFEPDSYWWNLGDELDQLVTARKVARRKEWEELAEAAEEDEVDELEEAATDLGTMTVHDAFEVMERMNNVELANLRKLATVILESRGE